MKREPATLPCALTIAGSDSSGGAGMQADTKTFAALGVYGASAVTAVTAQSTRGVLAWQAMPGALVEQQVGAVLEDLEPRAVKTGMLGSEEVVLAVARALAGCAAPLVVDPVLVATSGELLLEPGAERALVLRLVRGAALVTPNLPEAERLLGRTITTTSAMREAARDLVVSLGARAALVKGGHLAGDALVDVLFAGGELVELAAPRLPTTSTHGTGCTYSAAITAYLARGLPLVEAVTRAHAYLQEAIRLAPGLGRGHGPVHHLHPFYGREGISR